MAPEPAPPRHISIRNENGLHIRHLSMYIRRDNINRTARRALLSTYIYTSSGHSNPRSDRKGDCRITGYSPALTDTPPESRLLEVGRSVLLCAVAVQILYGHSRPRSGNRSRRLQSCFSLQNCLYTPAKTALTPGSVDKQSLPSYGFDRLGRFELSLAETAIRTYPHPVCTPSFPTISPVHTIGCIHSPFAYHGRLWDPSASYAEGRPDKMHTLVGTRNSNSRCTPLPPLCLPLPPLP